MLLLIVNYFNMIQFIVYSLLLYQIDVNRVSNYPYDSEQNQTTLFIPSDHSFFTPKYSLWFQFLCIPPTTEFTVSTFEQAMNRIANLRLPKVELGEIHQSLLKGNMCEFKPPFIPYITHDVEDKKKINVTLNIDLSNTDISVIECIVGDKEVDDDDYFQVHSVYKQNLAILSNDIDYNYYPPIYLYDSQLVQVQFFDILFILIHFNSPLFDTSSFTL